MPIKRYKLARGFIQHHRVATGVLLCAIAVFSWSDFKNTAALREGCRTRGNTQREALAFLYQDRVDVAKDGKQGAYGKGRIQFYTKKLPEYEKRLAKLGPVDCNSKYRYFGFK